MSYIIEEKGRNYECSYPHHWVKGDTLFLHRGGLAFSWGAANGARSGKEASASVKSHLKAHRKTVGMSADWDSDAWEAEAKTTFGDKFNSVFEGWSFLTRKQNDKEEVNMDLNKLRTEHNDLFKEVCAVAREGYITVDASTALHSDLTAQAGKDQETIKGLKSDLAAKDKVILTGEVAKNGAVAAGIMSTVLAESAVPAKLHERVTLDFQGFVKDGEPFTADSDTGKAFATAFTAEVGSWETDMGVEGSGPKGAADAKVNGKGAVDTDADAEYGKTLARTAGGKIRSDAA